jgi:putative mycofactocin binding protein MftB
MEISDNRQDGLRWRVSPHIRVRKESFGLLFYNTDNSRLTFVKSGELLQLQILPDREKRILPAFKPETEVQVRRLLNHISGMRLISAS